VFARQLGQVGVLERVARLVLELARRQRILDFLLETSPQKKQQLRQEGRLTATRASLRRVLAGRQLTPSKDDDARIDACTDLATLERWLDRAIHAASVSDVLR
jgi:hypothetical protein